MQATFLDALTFARQLPVMQCQLLLQARRSGLEEGLPLLQFARHPRPHIARRSPFHQEHDSGLCRTLRSTRD